MLRRLIAAAGALGLSLGLLVTFSATAAFACSCVRADTAQYAAWASEVFAGTVVATGEGEVGVRDGNEMIGRQVVHYDVQAERTWKGDPPQRVIVTTSAQAPSCGLPGLPEGREVLFFISPVGDVGVDSETRSISSCGGTAVLTPELEREATAALGEARAVGAAEEPAGSIGSSSAEESQGEHDPLMPPVAEIALAALVLGLPAVGLVVLALWLRRRRRA